MDVKISKKYLIYLFLLWIAPTICAIWGGPIWVTVSLLSFFAIYAGHEWIHVWVCKINNLDVETVFLSVGGKTHIVFEVPEEGPDKLRIEADVYLAGVVWDSVWFTISILSSITYALFMQDQTPFTFGISLIVLLIFLLAWPGSDWQEFMKRIPKGVR